MANSEGQLPGKMYQRLKTHCVAEKNCEPIIGKRETTFQPRTPKKFTFYIAHEPLVQIQCTFAWHH